MVAAASASHYAFAMRKLVPLVVLVGSAAACAVSPTRDPAERSAAPIIGGTNDTGDPGVVMVMAQSSSGSGGASICTGEVVSPHVVLTAAHCVSPQTVGTGMTFMVFTGTNVNDTSQQSNAALWFDVASTHYDTSFDVNNLQGGHDVAVVITNKVLGLPQLPYNKSPLPSSARNQTVRMIGYGITSGTDTSGTSAGVKRQTSTTLSDFDAQFLYFTDGVHQTCEGDSGGPALMTLGGVETIVGTVSFGDQGCQYGGTDTNVSRYLSFIDSYVSADLAAYTNLANGKQCGAASECQSGFCADGVCCDQACSGQCEACAESGSAGTCAPVAAHQRPRSGHQACAGTNATCTGYCDGTNRAACVMPGPETSCGNGGCASGAISSCNGQGACVKGPCPGNFACDGAAACKSSCAGDADCLSGFVCTQGACIAPGGTSCTPDGTSSIASDGSTVSCAPYLCDRSAGTCKTSCATNDDCAGVACNTAAGLCAPVVADTPGKTGCATSGGGGTQGSGATAIAAGIAALALAKRRRS